MVHRWRQYESPRISIEPLVVGWVPSGKKMEMMRSGNADKLPGYWLYKLQWKYLLMGGRVNTAIGRAFGKLFGKYYADKKI